MIVAVKVTDDRKPVSNLCHELWGERYDDKGYVSKNLCEELKQKGIKFVTGKRKNMKLSIVNLWDKLMLRKRFIIETVFYQLKNISQIEHTRHRNGINFMVNLFAGLLAYSFQEKKRVLKLLGLKRCLLLQL